MFIFEEPAIQEDEDRLDEMLQEYEYTKTIKEVNETRGNPGI